MQKLSTNKIILLEAVILLIGSLLWMTEARTSVDMPGRAASTLCWNSGLGNGLSVINYISKFILYAGMTLTVCTACPIILLLNVNLLAGTIGWY